MGQAPNRGPGQAPESSKFNAFWMPDQVRHDDSDTFCECIIIDACNLFDVCNLVFGICLVLGIWNFLKLAHCCLLTV